MPVVGVDKLVELQQSAEGVRNICILAHVDHGKTSLSDSLIATNGIISPKLAGTIRYLDSRPDEQVRGITMEASAISLYFSVAARQSDSGKGDTEGESGNDNESREGDRAPAVSEYLINLIDSPGHVDFQFEVSTASRLCDGAVVLVDAVEGVGSQTVAVLRQAWTEKLKTVLVINKMDRLATELKLSPAEAYSHLKKLVEQVNAVVGGFVLGDLIESDLHGREDGDVDPSDDADVYFSPDRNNVIFASAVDGWAFTIKQFAHIWARKTGMSRAVLEKTLWGDFYLDRKANRVMTGKQQRASSSSSTAKPMFVQLILDTIWAIYSIVSADSALTADQVSRLKSISAAVTPSLVRSNDRAALTKTVFSSWLPLSTAVLVTVVQQLPSPQQAQVVRADDLLCTVPGAGSIDPAARKAVVEFDSSPDAPVVGYVSKMVAVPESELGQSSQLDGQVLSADQARELARKKRAEIAKLLAADEGRDGEEDDAGLGDDDADPEHLIGFARLFSGTLSVGDSVYSVPPKYSPADSASPQPQPVKITQLYLLMGRTMEPIDSVPAGVIVGIEGLGGSIVKSGTISSVSTGAINLAGLAGTSNPIVRVALEPVNPADLDKMIAGLDLLVQADPCAVYELLDSGEYVIGCAGELHLERCIKDLTDRFARCEIQQGEPIVPFRETIVATSDMRDPADRELGRGRVVIDHPLFSVRLSVRPLPEPITTFLLRHAKALRNLVGRSTEQIDLTHNQAGTCSLEVFRARLAAVIDQLDEKDKTGIDIDSIVSFGPRRIGPNILIDSTPDRLFRPILSTATTAAVDADTTTDSSTGVSPLFIADKITLVFQQALGRGPLCHEPVQGIIVSIEQIKTQANSTDTADRADVTGSHRLTSDTIRLVRDGIHNAFADFSPRLLLATFRLEIQATTDVLGRVYAVITRRHGHVVDEYMQEGASSTASFFTVIARLPVVAAFGFGQEIRKRTSGAASAQLTFDGFDMLDTDPFWVPSTEEEIEDLGQLAERENVAKKYMDAVRARKGLFVAGHKLVENAEKQKTLKR